LYAADRRGYRIDDGAEYRKHTFMKAVVYHTYGSPDVLSLEEIPRPVPGDDEILVRVHAASVNAADWRMLRGEPFLIRLMGYGLLKPKHSILGADIAGRVEAVGAGVTRYQAGDEVFGEISESGFGGFAEYACAREDAVALKPKRLSFEEAAAVPMAGLVALQALRDVGRVRAGQEVLVNGSSGGVGTYSVQIAKAYGAEVTGVCSTRNIEMVRSIGADHVVDYTKEDFTRSGKQYDVIHAVNGYHPIFDYRRALRPGGTYVMTGGRMAQMYQAMFLGPLLSMAGGKKMAFMMEKPRAEDLSSLSELCDAGGIRPVIDKRYTLQEVPEAIRYLYGGHARGKVVISVDGR
jgi:NADPH:quinone reductase-like Zn-dependent oxidoreductase